MAPPPLIIKIDSREQRPLVFGSDVVTEISTLREGDYTAAGLEGRAAIERKSLEDLVGSLTFERERFDREIERLRPYKFSLVVVEADLDDVIEMRYRGNTNPSSIVGSIASIMARGVPFAFCGSPRNAAILVERLLRKCLKYLAPAATQGAA